MKKNHLLKILSSLIVKFSDVQAENFYFQVKFINCYLREIISFTKNKLTLETGASLGCMLLLAQTVSVPVFLRKLIATCNFPGGGPDPLSLSLDPPM